MNAGRSYASLAIVAGASMLIAFSSLVAGCGNDSKEAPVSTTSTSSTPASSAPVSPTEKSLSPTEGNKFTPPVVAPPAPTEGAGNHHHGLNGIG